MRHAVLVVGVVGCGRVGFVPASDANEVLRCDPSTPFSEVRSVPGLDNVGDVFFARFSADELEVYFHDNTGQVRTARRDVATSPFSLPTPIDLGAPGSSNRDVTLSLDGLSMAFRSSRQGGDRIWGGTRATTDVEFTAFTLLLPEVQEPQTQPAISGNNARLLYTIGAPAEDIVEASADPAGGFGVGVPLDTVNTSADETYATPSSDGLVIYFGREVPAEEFDIFLARRPSTSEPLLVEPVAELNSPAKEEPSWLSVDRCRLYFTRWDAARQNPRAFVAERRPD